MIFGRFIILFSLYENGWFFGISIAEHTVEEVNLKAYAIGIALGAGAIVLGIKK